MANQEQLDKLLKHGVQAWNEWRDKNPVVKIDLSDASLTGTNLRDVDLRRADLRRADLSDADLNHALLCDALLSDALLRRAILHDANLWGADLTRADLTHASFGGANLSAAKLRDADLTSANLASATLNGAILTRAIFTDAFLWRTVFANVDLSTARDLEKVDQAEGPSIISISTIYRSQGNIPEVFLKGAGVDDTFITYIRSLVGKAIEYYTCFISYSSKDEAFAKRLYADLQNRNVRCWFAPEDMKIGDRIRPRIDESIRIYDKLLLVLSEHSVTSKWVEFEVEAAMDKEQEGKSPVLFPVRLDNAVLNSATAWAAHIKRTRHIGDFTRWKDHDDYQNAFNRLLRDLKAEAQKIGSREGTTNGG